VTKAAFNVQFQGKGALKLLVTQIDHRLNLRGMAKSAVDASGDFAKLMGDGLLACLLEPKAGAEQYQAVVDIHGDTLAGALEGYFERSAQLPTLLRLAASPEKFAGLMLQRQPKGSDSMRTTGIMFERCLRPWRSRSCWRSIR